MLTHAFAGSTTIAFPIAMFYVALHVLPLQPTNGTSIDLFRAEANRAWQARGISFAVFIGIILFMAYEFTLAKNPIFPKRIVDNRTTASGYVLIFFEV